MGKNGGEGDAVKMQTQGMDPDAEMSSDDDAEEAPGRPKRRGGVALFPPNIEAAIAKRALAGERHVDLAREYHTRPENIGRYVTKYLKQHKRQASTQKKAPSKGGGKGYVFNSAAEDVPPKNIVTIVPFQGSEVDKLREELRRVHEAFGRVSLERDQLREKLNYRSRRGD